MIIKPRYNGPQLPTTYATQMTAAASGSSGIVVADSDEYDLGANDFALPVNFSYQQGIADAKAEENLFLRSQEFATVPWAIAGSSVSITSNAAAAPDGTTTADLIIPSAVSGTGKRIFQTVVLTAEGAVVSIFVKPSGYSKFGIRESSIAGYFATFDLSGGGTVIDTTLATATITAIAGGWYRVTMAVSATAGSNVFSLHPMDNSYMSGSPGAYTFTGDGTSGVLAWGAQCEKRSSVTAYTPTTTQVVSNLVYWLYFKYQDGNNYWGYRINSDASLAFVAAVNGLVKINVQSTGALTASQGKIIEGVFTCERESSGAAGAGNFYVNNSQLGTSVAITAASPVDISNTGSLYINGTNAVRNISDTVRAILLNFAPTASQVAQLYSSGIPAEWMWGSNVAQTSGTLTVGKNYRINTFVAGDSFTNVGAASNASGVQFTATGTTPTTWTNGSSLVQTGATLALLPETLPISPPLEWPDSANGNDGTLPAAGATKVVIRR